MKKNKKECKEIKIILLNNLDRLIKHLIKNFLKYSILFTIILPHIQGDLPTRLFWENDKLFSVWNYK